jgi:hypothetical protein
MDDTSWEQMMPGPKAPGGPIGPLTSHQFALSTVAAPAAVWAALTDGNLTRRYLLRSGPDDPPTFLTWQLRATPGGTTVRLQIDEIEGSTDEDAEDTWLPVLAALRAMLDPAPSQAPSQAEPATGEQSGPTSTAPIV